MVEAGILREDDRVELIDGEVVRMSPIGSRHAACVDRLTALFGRLPGRRFILRVQSPIALGEHDEPQPDIALLAFRDDFYVDRLPEPANVALVIEVADSSAAADREVKVPLYARAGIREVWLVDLPGATVEVFRRPVAGTFQETRRALRGDSLAIDAAPETALPVGSILG